MSIIEQDLILGWAAIIFKTVGSFFIIMNFAYSLMSVVSPIWSDNLEKNFFQEYKQIIDERIRLIIL